MFKLLPLLLLIVAMAGCAYVPTIRQGNYIDQDNVSKLKTGMSKAQVKFAVGTPMLNDSFRAGRWDYVYYVDPSNGNKPRRKHVIIYFQDDTVSRIVKRDMGPQQNKSNG